MGPKNISSNESNQLASNRKMFFFSTPDLQSWSHSGRWKLFEEVQKDPRASKCQSSILASNHKTKKSQKCWFHQDCGGHLMWSFSKQPYRPTVASLMQQGSGLGCSPPTSEGGKGPDAGTACSPTPRCSLFYGQALHKIKVTSSSLSFLNIILAQRCAHVRKSV